MEGFPPVNKTEDPNKSFDLESSNEAIDSTELHTENTSQDEIMEDFDLKEKTDLDKYRSSFFENIAETNSSVSIGNQIVKIEELKDRKSDEQIDFSSRHTLRNLKFLDESGLLDTEELVSAISRKGTDALESTRAGDLREIVGKTPKLKQVLEEKMREKASEFGSNGLAPSRDNMRTFFELARIPGGVAAIKNSEKIPDFLKLRDGIKERLQSPVPPSFPEYASLILDCVDRELFNKDDFLNWANKCAEKADGFFVNSLMSLEAEGRISKEESDDILSRVNPELIQSLVSKS